MLILANLDDSQLSEANKQEDKSESQRVEEKENVMKSFIVTEDAATKEETTQDEACEKSPKVSLLEFTHTVMLCFLKEEFVYFVEIYSIPLYLLHYVL